LDIDRDSLPKFEKETKIIAKIMYDMIVTIENNNYNRHFCTFKG